MNPRDSIITALTPGTPFNPQNKVWRSVDTLAQFAGLPAAEVTDLLVGDLAEQIVCRPSKKPAKGFLVALKINAPAANANQVQILGGPAVGVPQQPAVQVLGGLVEEPHVPADDILEDEDPF